MGHKFADLMFTPTVQKVQSEHGSRAGFTRWEASPDFHHIIDHAVASFIAERDSFYMASVSESDWPYLQHRGGPKGFLKIIDEKTLGFADYSGNSQYISTGNFINNDRVALFFMDYANRRRLKMLGRIERVSLNNDKLLSKLETDDYRAEVERGFIIKLEAYDWNCPQHITPRFDEAQVDQIIAPLLEENKALQLKIETFKKNGRDQPVTNDASEALARTLHNDKNDDGESQLQNRSPANNTLALTISGIRQLSPLIRSYELSAQDGSRLPRITPGAHIQVPVRLDDGKEVIRHYSIHNNPSSDKHYEIAVLLDEKGHGGSTTIHRTFALGTQINTVAPVNFFPLDQNLLEKNKHSEPIILLAAGIGITPIKSIAHALKSAGKPFHLHYTGKNEQSMAFTNELQQHFKNSLTLYSSEQSRMPLKQLMQTSPKNTQFYYCGPSGFLQAIKQYAQELKIDDTNLFFEHFSNVTSTENTPFKLELNKTGIIIDVEAEESMLEAIEKAGISIPNSCRTGNCRTCALPIHEGEIDHRDHSLSQHEQLTHLCPCVSRAKGNKISIKL